MAKYQEVFEDTQGLFDSHINQIPNLNEVNIKILAQNQLKEIGKIKKADDLLNHETGEDIYIFLNETIFEMLDDTQKQIVIEELVAQIYFNSEKGKVEIKKPDMAPGFSLVMLKHGLETYTNAKRLINELFSKKDQDNAENNDPEEV